MDKLGDTDLAKYPFLGNVGQRISEQGLTLETFATDPDYKPILDKAYTRILVASQGKVYPLISKDDTAEQVLYSEILSFLIAAILLQQSKAHMLIKRFSLAEARRVEKYLEADLKTNRVVTNPKFTSTSLKLSFDDTMTHILKESSISVEKKDSDFTITVPNYLERAVKFHEREWKLVNRKLDHGRVILSSHEIIRLFRTEIQILITNKIHSMKAPQPTDGFAPYVAKLEDLNSKLTPKSIVVTTEYPPCIKEAIKVLESGENLPHSGRFLVATFLLSRGKSIDEIVPIFKNAPDYNEKITTYQLKHLSGESSNIKYKCPSCQKVQMKDLCFRTDACGSIINPMQFGQRMVSNE